MEAGCRLGEVLSPLPTTLARFTAFHATNGESMWSYDVGPGPAIPVTYEVNDEQFVTVQLELPLTGETRHTFNSEMA